MSDNKNARLAGDNVKTEPQVKDTISQSDPQVQNTDVGPSNQDEASAATSAAEHQQPELSEPAITSTRQKTPTDRETLYPQNGLKKRAHVMVSRKQQETYKLSLISFRRTKEEFTRQSVLLCC